MRFLFAALLLVAFALGGPTHAARMDGGVAMAHVHDHGPGKAKCCPDGHELASDQSCQIACSGAVAVIHGPTGPLARPAYAVQYAAGPSAALRNRVRAPDPFPPKP
jgi:hypothetical protein